MRFKITGDWRGEYEQDGLLFCAQRIEEMLMSYTSHLYKVPVNNSLLLCAEYLRVHDLVKEKTIDQVHLSNILDEFADTFSSDIVIRENLKDSEIKHFISKLTGVSLPEQRKLMYYLWHVMSPYPEWASNSLRRAVSNPTGKKNIERALRSYLPMIIGMGYHPFYIFRCCKKVFRSQSIPCDQYLEAFLDIFNSAEHTYTVYFAIDKRANQFQEILEKRLGITFEQDKNSSKLDYDKEKYVCVSQSISAVDPYTAAINTYRTFNLFMRFYRFLGNREEEWCYNSSLTVDEDGAVEHPHMIPDRYAVQQDYDDKTLGKNSERIISKLLENSAGNDFMIINKIVTTHNTAVASHDAQNAFLNLWSILEIIGVFDHTDSKIKEIMRSIIPVLKRNYLSRIVEEMHDYLKANISLTDYNKLLDSLKVSGSEEYKIACLLMLPDKEDRRQEAYKLLKSYPLIRSRISQLYEDVFKDKKKYATELGRYEKRLSWHIQRLYRVRNSIIHSGESDENIKSLVEHLHSYVDEVILEIMDRLTQENTLGSISNVLIDAQVFFDNTAGTWSKDPFKEEDIKELLN